MRSKGSLLHLQRFRCDEKRRQAGEIEVMIAEFRRKQNDLELQIQMEEQRTGLADPEHFNYSTTAKSLRGRRDNLLRSIDELDEHLQGAKAAVIEQETELRRIELLAEKEARIALPARDAAPADVHVST